MIVAHREDAVAEAARLVATIAAPLDPTSSDAPEVLHWPGRRLLVQRGDTELVTLDLRSPEAGTRSEVRFPAPWARRFGTATVSPEQDAAVFAGVHEVQSVTATGAPRWKIRHGCWCSSCAETHLTFDEYSRDDDHAHAEQGSAAFSSDGSLVWAHVIGPLANAPDTDAEQELWVMLDAASGRVLGHAETMTVASNSVHTPYPDPARMGLSIGEGEEDSPALRGLWNGHDLTVERIGIERILLDVSPTGRELLTVPLGQWSLTIHDARDGSVRQELEAAGTVPPHPMNTDGGRVFWDYEAAFVDDDTIIAGTAECDARNGTIRHWVVDARTMALRSEVIYPSPVWGSPRSAGGGTWYTVAKGGTAVHLWRLANA